MSRGGRCSRTSSWRSEPFPPWPGMDTEFRWSVRLRGFALARDSLRGYLSENDRARARYHRAFLSAITMALARGANFGAMLIVVPLALHYLGPAGFGIFATVVAVTTMLGFADLGLGNGLINTVAEAHGRNDAAELRRQVSTAFVLLAGLAAALGITLAAVYRHVDWATILSASHTHAS